MLEFLYYAVICGQLVGWVLLWPETQQLDADYWTHCLFLDAVQGGARERKRKAQPGAVQLAQG